MDDMGDKKLDMNDVKTAFQDYNIQLTPAVWIREYWFRL